ncbi:MAG TPA: outer membrane protein assembly factor BamC [Burkholderiales bacterium]|nr:outer membrane protein assembly factor BamC [Burkholderiales bacterium]
MNSPQRLAAKLAAALALAGCLLAGCSGTLIEGKKIDYKSAGNVKPLNVPEDLSKPPTSDRYNIPESSSGSATASEYAAEGPGARAGAPGQAAPAAVLPLQDKVRFERAGSQRWLVVDADPDALWPIIKEFWQDNGFLIDVESQKTGVMETDWAENRAKIPDSVIRKLIGKVLDSAYSYPERDKFRTRLERSQNAGATEIYISHRGMAQVDTSKDRYTEKLTWQVRPVDPDLEAEMLSRLAIRLGARDDQIKAQAKTPDQPRATIAKSGELPEALMLVDSFDRAWRRVGLALDRVGFTVEDRDRSKGLYFVRYVDADAADKEKGFWSKMAFWRDDAPKKDEQYRISVSDASQGSEVKVLDDKGQKSNSPTAGRILALLQQELK